MSINTIWSWCQSQERFNNMLFYPTPPNIIDTLIIDIRVLMKSYVRLSEEKNIINYLLDITKLKTFLIVSLDRLYQAYPPRKNLVLLTDGAFSLASIQNIKTQTYDDNIEIMATLPGTRVAIETHKIINEWIVSNAPSSSGLGIYISTHNSPGDADMKLRNVIHTLRLHDSKQNFFIYSDDDRMILASLIINVPDIYIWNNNTNLNINILKDHINSYVKLGLFILFSALVENNYLPSVYPEITIDLLIRIHQQMLSPLIVDDNGKINWILWRKFMGNLAQYTLSLLNVDDEDTFWDIRNEHYSQMMLPINYSLFPIEITSIQSACGEYEQALQWYMRRYTEKIISFNFSYQYPYLWAPLPTDLMYCNYNHEDDIGLSKGNNLQLYELITMVIPPNNKYKRLLPGALHGYYKALPNAAYYPVSYHRFPDGKIRFPIITPEQQKKFTSNILKPNSRLNELYINPPYYRSFAIRSAISRPERHSRGNLSRQETRGGIISHQQQIKYE